MELVYGVLAAGVLIVVLIFIRKPDIHDASHDDLLKAASALPFEKYEKDVLVGTLRNTAQLDVCLQNGFYHIPCCQVQDFNQPIRYIAIYQSVTLFGSQAGVRYYGRVRKCAKVKRYLIKEVYSESDEEYYLFHVDEWLELPAVILPKETASISIRTNLFCLLHSVEIPQLFMESLEEFSLYEMLYEASKVKAERQRIEISGYTVSIIKKRIYLLQSDVRLWSCKLDIFTEKPCSVMACLFHYMGR